MRRIWRRLRWRSSISPPRWRRGSTAGASAPWASWPPCPPPRSSSASAVKGRACSSSRGARTPPAPPLGAAADPRGDGGARRCGGGARAARRAAGDARRSGSPISSPGAGAQPISSSGSATWPITAVTREAACPACSPERARGCHGAAPGLPRSPSSGRRGGGDDAPGAAGASPRRADVPGRSLAPEPAARHGDARPARRPGRRAADRRPRAARQPSPRRGRARALSAPDHSSTSTACRGRGPHGARLAPLPPAASRQRHAGRRPPGRASLAAARRAIVISAGPWRVSGEWWTERPWLHDEWDVELGEGVICRLTQDGSAWWLDGIYD